mmetsp:Transcript_11066/g.24309  ORF Transcript_11066/g.24309 Transcript_11066/m.24309 type:complete len:242 (-) Transcript_11066:236-961(-)
MPTMLNTQLLVYHTRNTRTRSVDPAASQTSPKGKPSHGIRNRAAFTVNSFSAPEPSRISILEESELCACAIGCSSRNRNCSKSALAAATAGANIGSLVSIVGSGTKKEKCDLTLDNHQRVGLAKTYQTIWDTPAVLGHRSPAGGNTPVERATCPCQVHRTQHCQVSLWSYSRSGAALATRNLRQTSPADILPPSSCSPRPGCKASRMSVISSCRIRTFASHAGDDWKANRHRPGRRRRPRS